ncbi:hypothetical protein FNV43_RR19672 [Rhamnella rubrinervis]|uniref:Uncharacterized protein n=1 Tax=Rhamnella rubrinervis TaxID=2594499 RepID=A0A8K0DZ84_9ROSA|nr:hypothetical protein FNV43_RR19672 [Rhamnella rubrinervis]
MGKLISSLMPVLCKRRGALVAESTAEPTTEPVRELVAKSLVEPCSKRVRFSDDLQSFSSIGCWDIGIVEDSIRQLKEDHGEQQGMANHLAAQGITNSNPEVEDPWDFPDSD